MLCGSQIATIDKKYRLKIPASFRREFAGAEENSFFVTSDDGRSAQIYPIAVWDRIARKFQESPRMDPAKLKLQKFTSFYGILTRMDAQGRVLIPQTLREDAQLNGDVIVMARNDHLEVWNKERIRKSLDEDPLTNADRERLAEQGF